MEKITKRELVLLKALESKKRMSIKEVIDDLGISTATARRFFDKLEKQGKLLRVHGGIQSISGSFPEYSFEKIEQEHVAEKIKIGSFAAGFVKDGDIIFLDSGTTVAQLAASLSDRLKNNMIKDITVVTNSLANLLKLEARCKTILLGGEYRSKRKDFAGSLSEKICLTLGFTCCYLGADAINFSEGLMASDADTAKLSEAAISRSQGITILADSSKFGKTSFLGFAPLGKANRIITDSGLTSDYFSELSNLGINIDRV